MNLGKWTALASLLFLFGSASACGGRCRVSSECDPGEFCDFVEGRCTRGCERDSDCGPSAQCDRTRGICRLRDLPRPGTSTTADAAILDATAILDAATSSTSTRADAGARD